MIEEDYVSYNVAKLLKEKGFNERTFYHYIIGQPTSLQHNIVYNKYCNSDAVNIYSAPTHQMAMRWLREVHKVHIVINRDNQYYEGKTVIPLTQHDKERGHRPEYFATILDLRSKSKVQEHCDTYEEAVEAALKYVLENLI